MADKEGVCAMLKTKSKDTFIMEEQDPYSIVLTKPKKPLTIQKVLAPKPEVLSPYSRVNKTVEHNGREILVGEVEDYYSQVQAISTTLNGTLSVGDRIVIRGTNAFMQEIESIQLDRKSVDSADKGKEVGIKVEERCRKGDKIFKVI